MACPLSAKKETNLDDRTEPHFWQTLRVKHGGMDGSCTGHCLAIFDVGNWLPSTYCWNNSGPKILVLDGGTYPKATPPFEGAFLSRSADNLLIGRRILVAEDESFIALDLERMLENFGCEVVGPVSSVKEVLQHAARGGFDGALLDVNLRGQQIFEILPKLKDLGLRLVITSGYDDVTLFPAAFRKVPRIAKPFDEKELRRICESVFASR